MRRSLVAIVKSDACVWRCVWGDVLRNAKFTPAAPDDLVVCRNYMSVWLNGIFPRFLDDLHRERACERRGNWKK